MRRHYGMPGLFIFFTEGQRQILDEDQFQAGWERGEWLSPSLAQTGRANRPCSENMLRLAEGAQHRRKCAWPTGR